MRKFLLALFLTVLVVALFYKSPFSALYNYNKAKALYDAGRYEQSLPYFERSLFADSKGILARFFYVLALSKSEPVYSVQKKLYDMASSKINDEAAKYAKIQAVLLHYKLLEGVENNYIYNAAMGSDIVRWDIKSFPLNVYIETNNDIPDYYYDSIDKALQQWTDRTNFVKFRKTSNINDAHIIIKFKDIPNDVCSNGVCKYSVAYTEPTIDNDKILKSMNLTVYKTNPKNENFSSREVFNTALHELGHTLGIMGHSDNPDDILYSVKDSDMGYYFDFYSSQYHSLSMRDLKTLALLYRIEPTISDKKNLHSENFYYAPLIMGNEDVRLQKKLIEYKKYIREFPHMAAGYINIASVYVDLGDYDSALTALASASKFVNNKDEEYLVAFNRAVIYYNRQDYNKALDYANNAKAVKNDKNVNDLIADIVKFR